MWGKHIEHSIREATKNVKSEKMRAGKAASTMRSLLTPRGEGGAPAPSGAFRDPAALVKGK